MATSFYALFFGLLGATRALGEIVCDAIVSMPSSSGCWARPTQGTATTHVNGFYALFFGLLGATGPKQKEANHGRVSMPSSSGCWARPDIQQRSPREGEVSMPSSSGCWARRPSRWVLSLPAPWFLCPLLRAAGRDG